MWSILRHIHMFEHPNPQRLTGLKKFETELNLKGIDFPVKLKAIKQFEKQNLNRNQSVNHLF